MDNEQGHALSLTKRIRRFFLGKARSATEPGIFHTMSLAAFLAWVGLGSDGISSACYGPAEAFVALGEHPHLAIFLALMTTITIVVISLSYMQIIELFPSGGGGYLVASKLLSPSVGMISGCALVIDYVLTITVSLASGADAIFSFLPPAWADYRLHTAVVACLLLTIINLRGVKESVIPIVPVFILFLVTHFIAIVYGVSAHIAEVPQVLHHAGTDLKETASSMGWLFLLKTLLHAYSMGGGTYTGIEAVSNGLPILREPRVQTGKRTMIYMAGSLALISSGLMLGYLVFGVKEVEGKTLNAVLFESIAANWPGGTAFVWVSLLSASMILLVAAQTGFLDGPRVLANMALDGWVPSRFGLLSDRLVTQNGILLMGFSALVLLVISGGDVRFLLVLYAINVFLTFTLSQLGMVRHWIEVRHDDPRWLPKIAINGFGLFLTTGLLASTTILKFAEGGWFTLLITGTAVVVCVLIKRHYTNTRQLLGRLNALVKVATPPTRTRSRHGDETDSEESRLKPQPEAHTAVVLVTGYNGLGLHSIFAVMRHFPNYYKNFVFLQVGVVDAGRFKGVSEIESLRTTVEADLEKYVEFMNANGFYAESSFLIGTDVVEEVEKGVIAISERFPRSVLFAGQLVFPKETLFTRWLHNYTAFAIQRRLYRYGLPVFILPIQVY